jgi:hypothetical protein
MEDEMGTACYTNGREEKCIQNIGWKPEGKRPLGRPRCRWVDNIKVNLGEIGWHGIDWIDLAQDRDHNMLGSS